mmetsp:Transcript_97068/g.274348  ORF Transcript_97068/g.274348 Transcript_97068/m.274348 type:complete len:85 (+) Transcript_97068:1081-1335(+)
MMGVDNREERLERLLVNESEPLRIRENSTLPQRLANFVLIMGLQLRKDLLKLIDTCRFDCLPKPDHCGCPHGVMAYRISRRNTC